MRFSKKQRIRTTKDFLLVREQGKHFSCSLFVLQGRETDLGLRRLGVIVSKRVAKSAVDRNRLRRLFKEIFRQNQEQLPLSCDIVLLARKRALESNFANTKKLFIKAKNYVFQNT